MNTECRPSFRKQLIRRGAARTQIQQLSICSGNADISRDRLRSPRLPVASIDPGTQRESSGGSITQNGVNQFRPPPITGYLTAAETNLHNKLIVTQLSRNSSHFMETRCSLPRSQQPATDHVIWHSGATGVPNLTSLTSINRLTFVMERQCVYLKCKGER
jgi:hypothetical protein